jgi:hypothetical protein
MIPIKLGYQVDWVGGKSTQQVLKTDTIPLQHKNPNRYTDIVLLLLPILFMGIYINADFPKAQEWVLLAF